MSSKCKQCGEKMVETGNYSLRIIPAKRIPKKSRKLMREAEEATGTHTKHQRQHVSSLNISKFRKYLEERSKPANFMELACGKCGEISQIKMEKTFQGKNVSDMTKVERGRRLDDETSSINIMLNSINSSKKKKKKKDVMAGLTLPSSLTSTTTEVGRKFVQPNPNQRNNQNSQRGRGGRRQTLASNAQRQTDLENLNKILFQSKKAKKSGSTLEDFLSSI